ncbi:hypothetical protein NSA23_16430 [Anaerosalibacter massiliensis]|uniref:Uncharacterized protein n=1 Tax=Anaerosalibacter massiliensis TaxID=1347392 RepID=A0A9X2MMB0_9FIRM|nr:hypothetical protein [Anaerosalibacter massiliensis]MCR2045670.1 hypothetical protein [Anaerosalibacter massiliensis]
MKKVNSIVAFTLVVFFTLMLIPNQSFATQLNNINNNPEAIVTVINNETGEKNITKIKPTVKKNNLTNIMSNDSKSFSTNYEIYVPIEDSTSKITPALSEGKNKTSGGVTARLSVDYDVSANNQKVRLNRIYGGWTPSKPMYVVSNRSVGAHTGLAKGGKKISFKPTSNSFNRYTGWGYNYRIFGDAAPRAWSSAKIRVSGMSGTSHTIKIEFTYSD